MKKPLQLPKFTSEDEERAYWETLDLSQYYVPADMVPISFPNLKPTSRSISIRIPAYLIDRLKEQAHAINIPYQSLIKQYIARGIRAQLAS